MEEFSFGVLGCFVSYRNYIISFPFSEEHFSVIMNSSPFLPCGSRSDQFNTVVVSAGSRYQALPGEDLSRPQISSPAVFVLMTPV